jgi:hypothetical protein
MNYVLPSPHGYAISFRMCIPAVIACLLVFARAQAQRSDSTLDKITGFPAKFFSRLTGKEASLDAAIQKQTRKYLERMEKKENKIRQALYSRDSAAASCLFSATREKYAAMQRLLDDTAMAAGRQPLRGGYLAYADSLSGMIGFLKQHPEYLQTGPQQQQLLDAEGQLKDLEAHLQATDQIRDFIRQRKQELAQGLAAYLDVPGISNSLGEYRKEAYYYSEQIRNYKEMLNDPDKMENLALQILDKMPGWQEFMQKNSILASLFPAPQNLGTMLALSGLQTRSTIQGMFQTQLSSGPNAAAMLSQNFQAAQNQLGQLRDKVLQYGQGADDMGDMPGFVPNQQRTRSLFQRLEFGVNIQSIHSSFYFPVTTDLGMSIGYKFNNAGIIGVGASFKLGWGSDLSHIHLSDQGAGLRSFLDWEIKKSFYATGGFEYNYQPITNTSGQIPVFNPWQRSGLVGITKTVKVKSRLFKTTRFQLLWDFLSYSQIPAGQPLIFRVGYAW